jgi:hypothetical protein
VYSVPTVPHDAYKLVFTLDPTYKLLTVPVVIFALVDDNFDIDDVDEYNVGIVPVVIFALVDDKFATEAVDEYNVDTVDVVIFAFDDFNVDTVPVVIFELVDVKLATFIAPVDKLSVYRVLIVPTLLNRLLELTLVVYNVLIVELPETLRFNNTPRDCIFEFTTVEPNDVLFITKTLLTIKLLVALMFDVENSAPSKPIILFAIYMIYKYIINNYKNLNFL